MVVINRIENDETSILSKGNVLKRTNLSKAIINVKTTKYGPPREQLLLQKVL